MGEFKSHGSIEERTDSSSLIGLNEPMHKGRFCLLAMIIAEKSINRKVFKATMSKIWKPNGRIQYQEVGENRFLMKFEDEQDKVKVLFGSTRFFDRFLVCL